MDFNQVSFAVDDDYFSLVTPNSTPVAPQQTIDQQQSQQRVAASEVIEDDYFQVVPTSHTNQAIAPKSDDKNGSLLSRLNRNFKGSTTGILLGMGLTPDEYAKMESEDPNLALQVFDLVSEQLFDSPALAAGSIPGGVAGGAVAGPAGAAIGASSSANFTRAFIKNGYKNWQKQKAEGRGSFNDYLETVVDSLDQSKFAALTGGAYAAGGMASKLLGIPNSQKLATFAANVLGKTAGVTGAQALQKGEAPTKKDVLSNLAAIATFQTVDHYIGKGQDWLVKKANQYAKSFANYMADRRARNNVSRVQDLQVADGFNGSDPIDMGDESTSTPPRSPLSPVIENSPAVAKTSTEQLKTAPLSNAPPPAVATRDLKAPVQGEQLPDDYFSVIEEGADKTFEKSNEVKAEIALPEKAKADGVAKNKEQQRQEFIDKAEQKEAAAKNKLIELRKIEDELFDEPESKYEKAEYKKEIVDGFGFLKAQQNQDEVEKQTQTYIKNVDEAEKKYGDVSKKDFKNRDEKKDALRKAKDDLFLANLELKSWKDTEPDFVSYFTKTNLNRFKQNNSTPQGDLEKIENELKIRGSGIDTSDAVKKRRVQHIFECYQNDPIEDLLKQIAEFKEVQPILQNSLDRVKKKHFSTYEKRKDAITKRLRQLHENEFELEIYELALKRIQDQESKRFVKDSVKQVQKIKEAYKKELTDKYGNDDVERIYLYHIDEDIKQNLLKKSFLYADEIAEHYSAKIEDAKYDVQRLSQTFDGSKAAANDLMKALRLRDKYYATSKFAKYSSEKGYEDYLYDKDQYIKQYKIDVSNKKKQSLLKQKINIIRERKYNVEASKGLVKKRATEEEMQAELKEFRKEVIADFKEQRGEDYKEKLFVLEGNLVKQKLRDNYTLDDLEKRNEKAYKSITTRDQMRNKNSKDQRRRHHKYFIKKEIENRYEKQAIEYLKKNEEEIKTGPFEYKCESLSYQHEETLKEQEKEKIKQAKKNVITKLAKAPLEKGQKVNIYVENTYVPKKKFEDQNIEEEYKVRGEVVDLESSYIPDTVYHVTIDLPAVMQTKVLNATAGIDRNGLAGERDETPCVCFSTSKKNIDQVYKDMVTFANLYRVKSKAAYLKALAAEEGFYFDGGDADAANYKTHKIMNHYTAERYAALGIDTTNFLADLKDVDPKNIGLISVPKKYLNTGALVTDCGIDLGFLSEVRVFSDVAVPEHALEKTLKDRNIVLKAAKTEQLFRKQDDKKGAIEKSAPKSEGHQFRKKNSDAKFNTQPNHKEIIDLFKKHFVIREGKLRGSGLLGVFKPSEAVIRIKRGNDLETVAHEAGHAIANLLWKDPSGLAKVLKENLDETRKLIDDPMLPDEEAIAELVRRMVVNPASNERLAPNLLKSFSKRLDSVSPELTQMLKDAERMYREIASTGALKQAASFIAAKRHRYWPGKIKQLLQGDVSPARSVWREFYAGLVDELYPLKAAMADAFGVKAASLDNMFLNKENAYRTARLGVAWMDKSNIALTDHTFDFHNNKKTGEGFFPILKELGLRDIENFKTYLVAKRSVELYSRDIEPGMPLHTAKAVIDEFHKSFEPFAQRVYKYQDRMLRRAVQAGFLNKKGYELIKKLNQDYVPFQRVMDEVSGAIGKGDQGLHAKNPIKRIRGSRKMILDPLQSIIENTHFIEKNIARNRLAQEIARLSVNTPNGIGIDEVPEPLQMVRAHRDTVMNYLKDATKDFNAPFDDDAAIAFYEQMAPQFMSHFIKGQYKQTENIITAYFDGKPHYYEVPASIKTMYERPNLEISALAKPLRFLGRMTRSGILLHPNLQLFRIPLRDFWERMLLSKNTSVKDLPYSTYSMLMAPIQNIFNVAGKSDNYIEFLKHGGGMMSERISDLPSSLRSKGKLIKFFNPFNLITAPLNAISFMGNLLDQSLRLSEYDLAKRRLDGSKFGKEQAAFESRDMSYDFARSGKQTRWINQFINFLNSFVQSLDKYGRSIKTNPLRTVTSLAIGVMIPTIFFYSMNRNDPMYKEIPSETRDNFLLLKKDEQSYYSIPLPYDLAGVTHAMTVRVCQWIDKDPKAFEELIQNIFNGILPDLLPAFAKGSVEVLSNYDFFRKKPIVPKYQQELTTRDQRTATTSETARYISRKFEEMELIDPYDSKLGPAYIDHLVKSYGGGLGRLILNSIDEISENLGHERDVPKIEESLIDRLGLNPVKRVLPNLGATSIRKFDELADEYERYEKSSKLAEKDGRESDAKTLIKDLGRPDIKEQIALMKDIRRQIFNIRRDGKYFTKDEKQKMLQRLVRDAIAFSQYVNPKIEKANSEFKKAARDKL